MTHKHPKEQKVLPQQDLRNDPGYQAADATARVACDPTALWAAIEGKAHRGKWRYPSNLVVALMAHKLRGQFPDGVTWLLLRLASFPHDRCYLRTATLADQLNLEVRWVRHLLGLLLRPWGTADADGQITYHPALYFVERRRGQDGRRRRYIVPNEAGWLALTERLWDVTAERQQALAAELQARRAHQQAGAAKARAFRRKVLTDRRRHG